MATIHDQYFVIAEEVTYAVPIDPAKYFEVVSEDVKGDYQRIETEALRAGAFIQRSDRWLPNSKGAAGSIKMEVLDKGFDVWFKHMLGSQSLATGVYTSKPGDLFGKSITAQFGRTDAGGTMRPFTYAGGKIKDWTLSCEVDKLLNLEVNMDFAVEYTKPNGTYPTQTAIHTPSYTTGSQLFSYQSAAITVAAASVCFSNFTLKCDNHLKDDRYFLCNNGVKKEPKEIDYREFTFTGDGEFNDLAHMDRIASATASGAMGTLSATFTSPQGATLVITAGQLRFDEGPANINGMDIVNQSITAKILDDGTATPMSIVYTPTP